MKSRLWMHCCMLPCVGAYINNNTKKDIICMTKFFIFIKCLFCSCPLPICLWVCVWESAQNLNHRSGALRLLIAHTNRLVIHVLPFMALFPAARGECLPPQVGSAGLASPVPRGRNRRLIRAPGCAVILLWKVFQAASQYWFISGQEGNREGTRRSSGAGEEEEEEIGRDRRLGGGIVGGTDSRRHREEMRLLAFPVTGTCK